MLYGQEDFRGEYPKPLKLLFIKPVHGTCIDDFKRSKCLNQIRPKVLFSGNTLTETGHPGQDPQ